MVNYLASLMIGFQVELPEEHVEDPTAWLDKIVRKANAAGYWEHGRRNDSEVAYYIGVKPGRKQDYMGGGFEDGAFYAQGEIPFEKLCLLGPSLERLRTDLIAKAGVKILSGPLVKVCALVD